MKLSLMLKLTAQPKEPLSTRLTGVSAIHRTWAKPRLVKSKYLAITSTLQNMKRLEFNIKTTQLRLEPVLSPRTLLTLNNWANYWMNWDKLTPAEKKELHRLMAMLSFICKVDALMRRTTRLQLSLLYLSSYHTPLRQTLLLNITTRKLSPQRGPRATATLFSTKL